MARRVEGTLFRDGAPTPWAVRGATIAERLDAPYRIELDVASDDLDREALSMLGASVELELSRATRGERWAGIVTEVRESIARSDRELAACLTIEPALAALRHRTDSRIFQHRSVPEILEAVLGAGLAPYGRAIALELSGSYPIREYTVQYDETDFELVHRLMEEEGIVYFFVHDGPAERMTLVDARAQHPRALTLDGTDVVRMGERRDHGGELGEAMRSFEGTARITGTKVHVRAFDWTRPQRPIETATGSGATLERYAVDAPVTLHGFADDRYTATDVEQRASRLHELEVREGSMAIGHASALGLRSGTRFTLEGHARPERDGEYLIVSATHRAIDRSREEEAYVNELLCVPYAVQWRPARTRRRPRIAGVQTATVVGPAGEEIHTDPHGRIKVQFHWDRAGQRDEHSSCWIRVAQTMGGPGWGFSFLPRIGMEVVVTFVNGDVDQPLVTGSVYNGAHPTPYSLPDDKTRLTLKTESTPGGEGWNELRFEDAASREEVYLRAEKDWNTLVRNDLGRDVLRDERQEVGRDRARKVGVDESVEIGRDRTAIVGRDARERVGVDRHREVGQHETVTIGVDRKEDVGNDEHLTVGRHRVELVGGSRKVDVAVDQVTKIGRTMRRDVVEDDAVSVGGSRRLDITGARVEEIGKDAHLTVGGDRQDKIGGSAHARVRGNDRTDVGHNRVCNVGMNETVQVGIAQAINVGGARSVSVGGVSSRTVGAAEVVTVKGMQQIMVAGQRALRVGGEYVVDVGARFVLQCGEARLVMENGDITLETTGNITLSSTKEVSVLGDGKVAIQASGGDVDIKGGPMIKLNS
ncbi:MAG: type VI secretion system Vgr family protein [Sandaracinaceae bacterium]